MAESEKIRLNLSVTLEVNDVLDRIAASAGVSRGDVLRQAIALMAKVYDAKLAGKHFGFAADPDRLDSEIIGLI